MVLYMGFGFLLIGRNLLFSPQKLPVIDQCSTESDC